MSGPYPPIAAYGLIGDCHAAALVSRGASIDWCCLPRFDSGSCFGRLLDWERGGCCAIDAGEGAEPSREYVDETMVLATTFRTPGGQVRVTDCFTMRKGGAREPYRQVLRVIDGERGKVDLRVLVAPRFDYGEVRPWLRRHGVGLYTAIGGDDGLVIGGDLDLRATDGYALEGDVAVRAGERVRLSLTFGAPETIEDDPPDPGADELDRRLEETIAWWRRWSGHGRLEGVDEAAVDRSAMVLKALTHAPTGAMVAAPTTSLPETPGGKRNWDYRFSWIRDSTFSVRALGELGHDAEAGGFARFVKRSAAGHAHELQILFGVGGERRLTEIELGKLEGYEGAKPVRVGNEASGQLQLDALGELVNQAWRWFQRGHEPDDDHWRFLVELIDAAAERWSAPDCGIWEWRGEPRHFTHSKAACWSAVDRGLRLAEACMRQAPTRRWQHARKEIREAVEARGYDDARGVFVQGFDTQDVDGALLLLPVMGFVEWDDERMVRTADAVRADLDERGLIRRYRGADGLPGREGAFLACSFWLVECLARQGRVEAARAAYDRAYACANDLGLFSEEFDAEHEVMLGNFPQGLTHLSHIAAAVALAETAPAREEA